MNDTSEVNSEWYLMWAQEVEAQRAQKAVLDNIKEATECDLTRRDRKDRVIVGSKGTMQMRGNW